MSASDDLVAAEKPADGSGLFVLLASGCCEERVRCPEDTGKRPSPLHLVLNVGVEVVLGC